MTFLLVVWLWTMSGAEVGGPPITMNDMKECKQRLELLARQPLSKSTTSITIPYPYQGMRAMKLECVAL